jgi:hypothetical protein
MKEDEKNKENFQCVPQWLNLLLEHLFISIVVRGERS